MYGSRGEKTRQQRQTKRRSEQTSGETRKKEISKERKKDRKKERGVRIYMMRQQQVFMLRAFLAGMDSDPVHPLVHPPSDTSLQLV